MFSTYSVDTPFGPVEVTPTDGQHVHVSAGSSGRNRLFYRGDDYYLSLHLGLYDGKWQPYRDQKTGEVSRTYLSLTRGIGDPAPKTYRAAIEAGVMEAVRAFLAAQKDVLDKAEEEDLKRAYEAAAAAEHAAKEAFNKAVTEANEAFLKLNKFYEARMLKSQGR